MLYHFITKLMLEVFFFFGWGAMFPLVLLCLLALIFEKKVFFGPLIVAID